MGWLQAMGASAPLALVVYPTRSGRSSWSAFCQQPKMASLSKLLCARHRSEMFETEGGPPCANGSTWCVQ